MAQQLFQCGVCEGLTPLVKKQDNLDGGIHHNYAECQCCEAKITINYTNKHIRGLLVRQQNTKPGKKKVELAELIQSECDKLKAQYE